MRYMGGAVLVLALLATPAWAVYVTDFNAPTFHDGNVGGQEAWPGSNSSSKIAVVDSATNGMIKIMASTDAVKSSKVLTNEAGDLIVDIDQLPGFNGVAGPNNIWQMFIRDDNNLDSVWWYGSGTTAKARVLNTVLEVPGGITGRTTLRSVVHPATHSTEYFYDKHDGNGMVLMGTLSGYTGTAGTWFRFENQKRLDGDGTDEYALFDNLSIVPEPASLLLLALGGLLLRRRHA